MVAELLGRMSFFTDCHNLHSVGDCVVAAAPVFHSNTIDILSIRQVWLLSKVWQIWLLSKLNIHIYSNFLSMIFVVFKNLCNYSVSIKDSNLPQLIIRDPFMETNPPVKKQCNTAKDFFQYVHLQIGKLQY